MSGDLHTVHVRVNDAATGAPTPVRIRIADLEGAYFPPLGRLAEFATGRNQDVGGNLLHGMKAHAYIDGTCEVPLPAGPILIEIHKGPEYLPQRVETALGPGKMALRLSIERWCDLRGQGWYGGDTRAHYLTPSAALLEGAAEDLAVVNLLVTECQIPGPFGRSYRAIPNVLAFSGQRPALEVPGHMVVVNTHNTHPALGSLSLLHCHRLVYPLSFGGPERLDDWALADWCDQCHRKKGLVLWTKPWHQHQDFSWGEPLADLILGKIDAYEMDFFEDSPFDSLPDWYTLLNCGFRVPLAGCSGKDSNGVALGCMRTYARLAPDEVFDYSSWIEAIRAGRTFITNGPLLTFTVCGEGPGAALDLGELTQPIRIRAEARSLIPFDHLELVANGCVVATAEPVGSPAHAELELTLDQPRPSWLAARCRGAQQLFHRPANQRIFAHASPVYLHQAGRSAPPDREASANLVNQLDRMLAWVTSKGRFANQQQRDHLAGVFQSAQAVLVERSRR